MFKMYLNIACTVTSACITMLSMSHRNLVCTVLRRYALPCGISSIRSADSVGTALPRTFFLSLFSPNLGRFWHRLFCSALEPPAIQTSSASTLQSLIHTSCCRPRHLTVSLRKVYLVILLFFVQCVELFQVAPTLLLLLQSLLQQQPTHMRIEERLPTMQELFALISRN